MKARVWLAIVSMFIASCSGGGGGDSPAQPQSGPKDSYPVGARPLTFPPFVVGPANAPGPGTVAVMQKLNRFWGSQVEAYACGPDALLAGCYMNAMVPGLGYIFYDRNLLNALDMSGSMLPADFFMAHEFGHNVQLALRLQTFGKNIELQADCLGGFYVGSQDRAGAVRQSDVLNAVTFACQIGDPMVSPWWATGAHGTCPERVAALQQGLAGYWAGLLPGQACPS